VLERLSLVRRASTAWKIATSPLDDGFVRPRLGRFLSNWFVRALAAG
tara:strand:+ start:477 stop:617 length:141 start_codon:yes stop_codon:yes gene_type:complete